MLHEWYMIAWVLRSLSLNAQERGQVIPGLAVILDLCHIHILLVVVSPCKVLAWLHGCNNLEKEIAWDSLSTLKNEIKVTTTKDASDSGKQIVICVF